MLSWKLLAAFSLAGVGVLTPAPVPERAPAQRRALLSIRAGRDGTTSFSMQLNFDPAPADLDFEALRHVMRGPAEGRFHGGGRWFEGTTDRLFPRQGAIASEAISFDPLLDELHALGVREAYLTIRVPSAGFSRAGFPSMPLDLPSDLYDPWSALGRADTYHLQGALNRLPRRVEVEYGWTSAQLSLRGLALLGLFLAPFLIGCLRWRRAIRSLEPEGESFRLWMFLRGLTFAFWVLWLGLTCQAWVGDAIEFFLPRRDPAMRTLVSLAVYLGPPILTTMFLSGLALSAHTRFRGLAWSGAEIVCLAIAGPFLLLPVCALAVAVAAAMASDYRQAVSFLVLGVVLLAVPRLLRPADLRPRSVTTGPLRDRIFALAEKAGVPLKQVFLLPARRLLEANACAVDGGNLMLTDYLLENLSADEVDAVVAHELAHLKLQHPGQLFTTFVLTAMLVFVFGHALTGIFSMELPGLVVPPWPLGIGLGVLVMLARARRFEYVADAEAVRQTGRPDALVTGLARINHLSLMPHQFARWQEQLLTHPSTLRRLQAIARTGGIPPERLRELLDNPPAAGERYPLPGPATDETPLFSSTFKNDVVGRNALALFAELTLPPLGVALLARALDPPAALLALVFVGGFALTLALSLWVANLLPGRSLARLAAPLRERLEAKGMPSGGLFVGLSPDAAPRVYEGFGNWDVGFLFLGNDRLACFGEQVRFALRRDQIVDVRLGPGLPGWWTTRITYVDWKVGDKTGTFNLRHGATRSVRDQCARAGDLCRLLTSWRQREPTGAEAPAIPADLGPPEIGAVTSVSPTELTSKWPLSLVTLFLVGSALSLLVGMSWSEPGFWYVPATSVLGGLFHQIPYFRYREAQSPDADRQA